MKKIISMILNIFFICLIFISNYFYLSSFKYELKLTCSGLFVLLGLINLIFSYIKKEKRKNHQYYMILGLVFAFLGDAFINYNFIIGALNFAIGHLFFFIAYSSLSKIKQLDLIVSLTLIIGCIIFLSLPTLNFQIPILRYACMIYAILISTMLGKSIGNLINNYNVKNLIISIGSLLFFISDLMLVLNGFLGVGNWASYTCIALYYPALSLLALSMNFEVKDKNH